MSAAIPATVDEVIIGEVNNVLASGRFADPDSLKIRRLLKDAHGLFKVKPWMAHADFGCIYQIVGDVEKLRYSFKCSLEMAAGEYVDASIQKGICILNLGFFSEAQQLFKELGDPTYWKLVNILPILYGTLAFEFIDEFQFKAHKMKIDLTGLDFETASRATAILKKHGVTEDQLAAWADVAGDVIRENKLFLMGDGPDIDVADDDGDQCIYLTYRVKTKPQEAVALYQEVSKRLIHAFKQLPAVVNISVRAA